MLGCGGAPKGESGKAFKHRNTSASAKAPSRTSGDPTRRTTGAYLSTPDLGFARGLAFEDTIPIGARVTAVNVATGNGVKAIWFSYERNGVASDTPRRGGSGGFTRVFELKKGEKIVGLDGDGRGGIDRLTIVTNKRAKTFSDAGETEAESWLTKKQTEQYVGVGISGRADDKLRQLSLTFQVRE